MNDQSLFDNDTSLLAQSKPSPSVPAVIDDAPSFGGDGPAASLPVLHSAAEHTLRVGSLIEMAVANKLDPAALEKLVALQERAMAKQAEAEFDAAKRAFQSE